MNNHHTSQRDWLTMPNWRDSKELTRAGIVTALYIVITFALAPISFGPIQFRLSEALNYTGLYNKRNIYAVTLGVFIVNVYQYGVVDMVVGSFSTYVALLLGRWLGDLAVEHLTKKQSTWNLTIVRYAILAIVFSLTMFGIAAEFYFLQGLPFWESYFSLALSELAAMTVGGIILYTVSRKVDLEK